MCCAVQNRTRDRQKERDRQIQRKRRGAVHHDTDEASYSTDKHSHSRSSVEMLQGYHQALFVFATFVGGGDSWVASYLVLLLEAVALGAFHLGDVLEEVCHADGRVQLTRLIRHVDRLPLPQGVSVGLHQAAGVAAHVLALICGT